MKRSASKQESAVRGRARGPSGGPGAGGSPDDILFEQPVQAAQTLGTTDDGWGAVEASPVPGHADLLGGPDIMDLLSGSQNNSQNQAPVRPVSGRPNAGPEGGVGQLQPQRAQQTPRPPRSRPGGPMATASAEVPAPVAAASRPTASASRSSAGGDQGSGIRREGTLTATKVLPTQFGRKRRSAMRVLLALGCLGAAAGASMWLHNVRHNPVLAAIAGAIGAVLGLMSWLSSR
jgi:hypothetical protein